MTVERKALVLSFVHSSLAVRNLEVAVHEAKMDKDPDYKMMANDLKMLQDRMKKTFIKINKKIGKDGANMAAIEEELDEIQDNTWNDPALKV